MNSRSELAAFYDEDSGGYDSKYLRTIHLAEDAIVADVLRHVYRRGNAVLDVGSGTGMAVTLGKINKDDYLGLDLSNGMVGIARTSHPEHSFLHCDATLFDGEMVDLVLAIYGQINYMGIGDFLGVLNRHLKKPGKFMAVIYTGADNADVSTPDSLQTIYEAKFIFERFKAAGFDVKIKGLSYLGGILSDDMRNSYEFQAGASAPVLSWEHQKEFKYMIVSNAW